MGDTAQGKSVLRRDAETQRKDFFFYVGELESEECVCGGEKQGGKAFCYRCFAKLPYDMRRELYSQLGEGFEAAYNAAVDLLEKEG